NYLINRHEILRTTFSHAVGCSAQIIHPSAPPGFSFIDLVGANCPEDEVKSILRDESLREIDLEKLPIRRDILIKIADSNFRLIRISHSLITDGLASRILELELPTLYKPMLHGQEPPLPKEP